MKALLAVLLLTCAVAQADSLEPDEASPPRPLYLGIGVSQVMFTPAPHALLVGMDTVFHVEGGYRLGHGPFFAHAVVGGSDRGFVDARGGLELRAGGFVKGVFGIDLGYTHDPRPDVEMAYSIEGPTVAPRAGIEVGSERGFARVVLDLRYPISERGGHGGGASLAVGREF